MNTTTHHYQACRVECSHFAPQGSEIQEWMLQIHFAEQSPCFLAQLRAVLAARAQFCEQNPEAQPVFARFFLTDAANQESVLREELPADMGAVSCIEQPLLDGTKVSLWLYMMSGVEREYDADGALLCRQGDYTHHWMGNARLTTGDSREQSYNLFDQYTAKLEAKGGSLFDNPIRTWLFVQNVDCNYAGVVVGRNEKFDEEGLTVEEHFISSTGIQGRSEDHHSLVQLDAYSVLGIDWSQIQFLYAPEHLNPTHEYGVRFERGTAVHYSDRSHAYISGTASIDNKGEVVHIGDIVKQCDRMIENVEALLAEADMKLDNIAQIILYLRDMGDYAYAKQIFDQRFPETPRVIVHAPVCRPTWLIEMECIAWRG